MVGEGECGWLERVSVDGWGGGCLGRVIVGVWKE